MTEGRGGMRIDQGAAGGSEPKAIESVSRALQTLEVFAASDQRTLGVSEISRILGLSRSGVYRILVSLKAHGLVEQHADTARYSLGVGALRLGLAFQQHNDLVAAAVASLETLCRTTGETSTLSIRQGWSRVYLDQRPSAHELRVIVNLGVPYPLHAGASSKVILAHLSEKEKNEYFAENTLEQVLPNTFVDEASIRTELDTIRERGYATSSEERQLGAVSSAAPLISRSGRVIGSLSVTGPVQRLSSKDDNGERVAALVMAEARRVSANLS